MKKSKVMITHSIYNKAIDLLYDSISMLNDILDKTPSPKRNLKATIDIRKSRDTMKYAIEYIRELELLADEVQILKQENAVIKKANNYLKSQLRPFVEVQKQLLSGSLQKTVEIIEKKLEMEEINSNV